MDCAGQVAGAAATPGPCPPASPGERLDLLGGTTCPCVLGSLPYPSASANLCAAQGVPQRRRPVGSPPWRSFEFGCAAAASGPAEPPHSILKRIELLACEEALSLGCRLAGPEHLLLGLLRVPGEAKLHLGSWERF